MSLKIGIVGLPNVGKSTLFQALTKKEVDRSNYPFATIAPNIGVVEVPDERLYGLAELSRSRKIVPAIVEFVDIAGLVKGAAEGAGLGNKFLQHIREVDAILEVVRDFEDPSVTHVEGTPDPKRDIEILETELILKDLETAEKALGKFEKETKTGDKKTKERFGILQKLISSLGEGKKARLDSRQARQAGESEESREVAKELGLLTAKPILYCFNVKTEYAKARAGAVLLDIKQEFELTLLNEAEIKELGIKPKLSSLIQKAYEVLDLMTFFTTGEDETRAWTIPRGSRAPRAGRAIHGDFEKKFIKALVISHEKLVQAENLAKARDLGWLRTEGKDYEVKDGDVIEFKI